MTTSGDGRMEGDGHGHVASLPRRERRYLDAVVARARSVAPDLVGAYLFGSGAYGGYRAGRSDLDVQLVVPAPLSAEGRHRLVDALRHGALPCPARQLELVVYPRAVVARPVPPLAFDVNLNTGAGRPDHVATDPAAEPSHWFLLDVAIGRELGVALAGPHPTRVFGPVPRPAVLAAVAGSLAWHLGREATSADTVLNACRSWRFVRTGEWGPKADGAAWALAERPDLDVVRAAAARRSDVALPAGEVRALVEEVAAAVDRARAEAR